MDTPLPPDPFRRAPFASNPYAGRGRVFAEPSSRTRTEFQRDRDRVLHSTPFRRLNHKTQVFISHEGDHYRSRLTHSLEVSQVARSLARRLKLDEDLAETLALAHDLGHPPFGHEGEDALHAVVSPFGGFDHNAQSFRLVTALERRYALFDGLNLTWETLEGLVKHNGPLTDAAGVPIGRYAGRPLPWALTASPEHATLELHTQAGPEAQVAAVSDDVAYSAHDIDDGLRAGLFELEDLRPVPMIGDLLAEVDRCYPGLERPRRVHEFVRRVVHALVEDVDAETQRRLDRLAPQTVADIRAAAEPFAAFSPAGVAAITALRKFLFVRVYRHPQVMRIRGRANRIVTDLARAFLDDPGLMPSPWCAGLGSDAVQAARRVTDYISGMTDRYAVEEHQRLFDDTPDLS